jgi:HEPN pEK499 p136
MDYNNLVSDFIKRTKTNLEFIELHKDDSHLYEFTQLINSLLGIVVLPRERSFKRIPPIPFEKLIQNDWKLPTILTNNYGINNLRALIRVFRNSVAHFNIRFLSNNLDEIDGIIIYNKRGKRILFEAVFTLQDLREFINKLSETILNIR